MYAAGSYAVRRARPIALVVIVPRDKSPEPTKPREAAPGNVATPANVGEFLDLNNVVVVSADGVGNVDNVVYAPDTVDDVEDARDG